MSLRLQKVLDFFLNIKKFPKRTVNQSNFYEHLCSFLTDTNCSLSYTPIMIIRRLNIVSNSWFDVIYQLQKLRMSTRELVNKFTSGENVLVIN